MGFLQIQPNHMYAIDTLSLLHCEAPTSANFKSICDRTGLAKQTKTEGRRVYVFIGQDEAIYLCDGENVQTRAGEG